MARVASSSNCLLVLHYVMMTMTIKTTTTTTEATTTTTTTTTTTEATETRVIIDLAGKSDNELLLMIKESVQRIKEIVGELKSPTVTPSTVAPSTAPNAPTANTYL